MYSDKGQCLKTFTSHISHSWLCGIDNKHNSHSDNKLYKIFSTQEQKWLKTHLQEWNDRVYDVIYDNHGSVWRVGYNKRLTKYTTE